MLKEMLMPLVSGGVTILGVVMLYLLQLLIKKIASKAGIKMKSYGFEEITGLCMAAEKLLGAGQGKAKLLYVLQKLGLKENDKKAIKKINEVHNILKTSDILNGTNVVSAPQKKEII